MGAVVVAMHGAWNVPWRAEILSRQDEVPHHHLLYLPASSSDTL